MTTPLVPYRHPRAGFSLPLPTGWQQLTDPRPDVALIVTTAPPDVGFRTNAVLTVEQVPEMDLVTWQFVTHQLMERGLTEFALLDEEEMEIAGWAARHRLAHHRVERYAVTLEQWAVLDRGQGYTLTCSAESWTYDGIADLFQTMGQGFRPRPGTPS